MITIPGSIGNLNVSVGDLLQKGQRERAMIAVEDIERLGIAEGSQVAITTPAGTNHIAVYGGTVTGFGQTFEKKGRPVRYVYIAVGGGPKFPRRGATDPGFDRAKAILMESGDPVAAKAAYDQGPV